MELCLQQQLLCPVCSQIYNKPVVILPCQHNLCRSCAQQLYQASTSFMRSSGRFRCPSCKKEVLLDRHGVYGLQRNLLVENIIDAYNEEVSKEEVSKEEVSKEAPCSCEEHEGEKLNIYCLSCCAPTCSLCKVFGAHQSCRVEPLSAVCQQQKDELREGLKSLEEQRMKIQTEMDDLHQMCSDLEESYQMQKLMVCEQLEQLQSSLKERRKSMTEVISAEEEEKSGRAKALMQRLRDSVAANEKLLERATAAIEDADSVAFVQSSSDVLEKVRGAIASCPSETLDPEDESLSHYQYDFSHQYRVLVALDFHTAEQDVPEESESEAEDPEDTEDTESHVSHTQTAKDCPLVQPPAAPLLLQDGDPEGETQQDGDTEGETEQDRDTEGETEQDGDTEGETEQDGDTEGETEQDGDTEGETEELGERDSTEDVDRCHVETVMRQRRPELMEDTHQRPAATETDEGMSTLQLKGNAAGSDDDTLTPHQEPNKPEENPTNLTPTDETEAVLYPEWYGRGTWGQHRPINEENQDANIAKRIRKVQEVAGILQGENEAEESPPPSGCPDETLEKSEELEQMETRAAAGVSAGSFSSEEKSEDVVGTPQISDWSERHEGLSSVLESVGEDLITESPVGAQSQQVAPESQPSGTAASVALQAVTLLFYLVAFLVILQRFWVYVGRYILI